MRSTILLTSFLGLTGLTLVGACGDDGDNNPVDAAVQPDAPKPIDAAIDAPHVFDEYDADEGGEVRVEYIQFANTGLTNASRGFAHFYKNPGTPAYHDYINIMGCNDVSGRTTATPAPGAYSGNLWPMVENLDAVHADAGQSVTLISENPTHPIMTLPKRSTEWRDPLTRLHPANMAYWDANTQTATESEPTNYQPATYYDVVVPGGPDIPSQIFDKGIYIPAAFALTSPGLSTTAIVLPADTDATFTWTVPTETPPAGTEVFSLLALQTSAGIAVLCVEKNDGSITVPAAMVNIARGKAGASGNSIARQVFVHQVRELEDNNGLTGRRVDLVGVWCYAGQPWALN